MMYKVLRVVAIVSFVLGIFASVTGSAQGEDLDGRIRSLDEELAILKERQAELKKEATAAADSLPTFSYRPGNGVTLPRVLHEERPQYTSDAMRAKVQGTVLLECVVRPDGTVGDVQLVRSLDPTFGLDQQAIAAAKKWRFVPGTRLGEPVPVLVTIELTFTLR